MGPFVVLFYSVAQKNVDVFKGEKLMPVANKSMLEVVSCEMGSKVFRICLP